MSSAFGRLVDDVVKGMEEGISHGEVKSILRESGKEFKTAEEAITHVRGTRVASNVVRANATADATDEMVAAGRKAMDERDAAAIEHVKHSQRYGDENFDNRPPEVKARQQKIDEANRIEEQARKAQEVRKSKDAELNSYFDSDPLQDDVFMQDQEIRTNQVKGNQTNNPKTGKTDPHEDAKVFDVKNTSYTGKTGYAAKKDQQTANDIFNLTDTEKLKNKLGGFGFDEAKTSQYIAAGSEGRQKMLQDQVKSRSGRDLSFGENMGYYKVPQKAAVVGTTAWLISSMSSSKGQQSNAQLYGQQSPYGM
jgi:hypothetical protein